jgi:hypothetical protein
MLADLFLAATRVPHPNLPKQVRTDDPAAAMRKSAALERARERERAIANGEIT